jgi:hypothetical protein
MYFNKEETEMKTIQMSNFKKRMGAWALVTLMVLTAIVINPITVWADTIIVEVDGARVIFDDQDPVIVDGRTLIPVRGVFEEIGFNVSWDGDLQQVTLTDTLASGYVVIITIGSSTFTTNGIAHTLDVPAQIINGRTMLPIRAVLESVSIGVDWDGSRSAVLISTVTFTLTNLLRGHEYNFASIIDMLQAFAMIRDALSAGESFTISEFANADTVAFLQPFMTLLDQWGMSDTLYYSVLTGLMLYDFLPGEMQGNLTIARNLYNGFNNDMIPIFPADRSDFQTMIRILGGASAALDNASVGARQLSFMGDTIPAWVEYESTLLWAAVAELESLARELNEINSRRAN